MRALKSTEEFKAAHDRLDEMDRRLSKVIARDKPLQPDRTTGRKRLKPDYVAPVTVKARAPGYAPIASGTLVGNEMPYYEPPECREDKPGFDYTRDVIFAAFTA